MSAVLPFLEFQQVAYSYPGRASIVQDVDWRLEACGFHCLVGRSGCGKTTLLKLAAGLLSPQSGAIRLADGSPAVPGPQLGYMFQAPTLLEWLNVLDNVLLPLSLQRKPQAADHERALALLRMLGLQDYGLHHPRQLSGGQQSRVALARALILDPALLLLDEPFAALDAITRGELQDDLMRMCRLRSTTVLFVTHDIGEAVYLSDRVGVMHQGRLLADIAIDLPAPRQQTLRHDAPFNAYCAQIHAAMTGGLP